MRNSSRNFQEVLILKSEITIRELQEKDIAGAVDLLLRLKKLNGEFDSTFNVADSAGKEAEGHLQTMVKEHDKHLAFVAIRKEKLVGIIAVNLLQRCYYEPKTEARIVEFYVMPEARRTGAGKLLVDKVYGALKARDISLITAEFPALNPIALNFYKDLGFREIVGIYGKKL